MSRKGGSQTVRTVLAYSVNMVLLYVLPLLLSIDITTAAVHQSLAGNPPPLALGSGVAGLAGSALVTGICGGIAWHFLCGSKAAVKHAAIFSALGIIPYGFVFVVTIVSPGAFDIGAALDGMFCLLVYLASSWLVLLGLPRVIMRAKVL